MKKYICSLDIGSSKIAGCCAELKAGRVSGLTCDFIPVRGVRCGTIIDSFEFVDCVGRLVNRLKEKSGVPVRSLVAGVSGQDIITKHSRAVIPLAERGSKVVTSSDIEKVNRQARVLGSCIDEEIIHAIPFNYCLDGKADIGNPAGLCGHKLEADVFLVCARLPAVQTLIHSVSQAGFDVDELYFSGLASNEVVFPTPIRRGSDILCDIGADFTELLFFADGQLRAAFSLPCGGSEFTAVVADSLDVPLDFAEEIRVSHGQVGDFSLIREDQEILLKKESGYKPIRKRLLCEILSAKAKSMCRLIRENVEKICSLAEVNNFVLLGRTAEQEGFLELLEQELAIGVEYGRVQDPRIAIPAGKSRELLLGRRGLSYITALGLVYLSLYSLQRKLSSPLSSHPNPLLRMFGKAKEIYQEYF